MNIIHACGALKRFLDARDRGALEEELKALSEAAQLQALQARSSAPKSEPRGVVVSFARKREW